jgi:hypothetical protein
MQKIVCTTCYESLFFSFICLIIINLQIREKSMTFIISCTNNYFRFQKQITQNNFEKRYEFKI